MATAIGIVTYRRPDFFQRCALSVLQNVTNDVMVFAYNDGSSEKEYAKPYRELAGERIMIFHREDNRGVAYAKNVLLREMMDTGMDHLFLIEDDIEMISPKCLSTYIETSSRTNIEHFNFAHHGPANEGQLVESRNGVDFYLNGVGAFSYFTRHVIETVGYLDENLKNAYEHLEHTFRIAKAGLTTAFWRFADVSNSRELLREIAHQSVIGARPDWAENIARGRDYFRAKHPDCPI